MEIRYLKITNKRGSIICYPWRLFRFRPSSWRRSCLHHCLNPINFKIIRTNLWGVENFICKNFTHWFDSSESRLSATFAHEVNGLVDSSEWRNVDSLSSDDTTRTDSCWVFSGTTVSNSINENLEWVFSSSKGNNIECLFHDSDSLLLFTTVSSFHHEAIQKALNNWAVYLLETSLLVSASCEWQENLRLNCFQV